MKLKKLVWPLLLLVALCLIAGGCGGGGSSSFSGNSGDVTPTPIPSGDVTPAWVGSYHGYGNILSFDETASEDISADIIIELALPRVKATASVDAALFSSFIIVNGKVLQSEDKVAATVSSDSSDHFLIETTDSNTILGMTLTSDSSFVMTGFLGDYVVKDFAVTKASKGTPTDDTISASDLAGRWKIDALVLSGDSLANVPSKSDWDWMARSNVWSVDVSGSFDSSILITENNFIVLHVLAATQSFDPTSDATEPVTIPTIESLDLGKISLTKVAGSYYKFNVSSDSVTSDSSIVFDSATTATAYFDFRVSRDTDVINIAGTYDLTKVTGAIKISSADLFGTWSGNNFIALNRTDTPYIIYPNVPVVCALSMEKITSGDTSVDVPYFYISADIPGDINHSMLFALKPELVVNVDDTLVYALTRTYSVSSVDMKVAITENSDKTSAQLIWSSSFASGDSSARTSMVGNIEKISDTVSNDNFYAK